VKKVFGRPEALSKNYFHYCPGCGHGVAHRLVAEAIDELGILERTVGVCPVGCAVYAYDYFECDMIEASHGRAPAVATAVKRVLPESMVFAYQGDGDLAAIGTAEIIHAAARGENFTTIFLNNGVYGMTQGQMAPTTPIGEKTSTSPSGRAVGLDGNPIRICELLNTLDGPVYLARVAITSPKTIARARRCIRRAFEVQMQGLGFSLVEVLATCPTYWRLTPQRALAHIEERVIPAFPLGEFRVPAQAAES
jgi:2-oxoglutarate ferredoxin oxidoreductase subunit beta